MIKTKMNFSPEFELLRLCAQVNTNNRSKNVVRNDLNWPYILQESIIQGTTCLLYYNLLESKHKIPENIWESLKGIYYKNIYRNTKICQDISIVLSSFNKEDLKVIPLKGIFLAEKVYNNIALRAMTDIDLLVKKEDLPKIDEVLDNLGYSSPIHKQLRPYAIKKFYLNSIDYFKADEKLPFLHIHWHIVNVTLPTYMYSKNIKMD